jgi:hypothetical protein
MCCRFKKCLAATAIIVRFVDLDSGNGFGIWSAANDLRR